jgi:isochorismate synthase
VHIHSKENTFSLFQALFQAAQEQNFSVAFWRLPQTTDIHFIADFSSKPNALKVDLEELHAGFAFSPFENPGGSYTYFINADLHYTIKNGQLSNQREQTQSSSFTKEQNFWKSVSSNLGALPLDEKVSAGKDKIIALFNVEERDYFTEIVARGRRAIAIGSFLKVVLSRTKEVKLPESFNAGNLFSALCEYYPQAFVSWVSLPDMGSWMGASPETLISIDRTQIFKTVSLAGTQPYWPQIPVSRAVWTQKEIEEQALVSRYIVNCFKKIRLREYEEVGPKTVVAGNLMHLRTDFTVDMHETQFPQLGTVMLDLLHPTSAVCGMPKEAALNFIKTYEKHDRGFYTGFLGPVNIADETHLFVNLRCMQIQPGKALLYAGAGVTADSNPEREWAETELKCQTLLQVLEKALL